MRTWLLNHNHNTQFAAAKFPFYLLNLPIHTAIENDVFQDKSEITKINY